MQIKVKNQPTIQHLYYFCSKTGDDITVDFIGNASGFDVGDAICYDAQDDVYKCSQGIYEYWSNIISLYETLDDKIDDLLEDNPDRDERVHELTQDANAFDFDDYPGALTKYLDEEKW